jgi:hypothetical protein
MLYDFILFYCLVGLFFDVVAVWLHKISLSELLTEEILWELIVGLVCWPLIVIGFIHTTTRA